MRENLIVSGSRAYGYPLLIKQLLTNSLSLYGDQEIAPTCCARSIRTGSGSTRCPRPTASSFVAEIPKTSVGKINNKVLRERNA